MTDRTATAELTLWAESPEEARIFLARAARQNFPYTITRVFVAKRSPKNRTNEYIDGQYYQTSNDASVTVFEDVIVAPSRIIDLVQWCTCDVMLSLGDDPVCVLEDTTHIVRMNVYQRVPRLFRAAMYGVPALALQGTRGLDFTKRGDCWGMHRYIRAFAAISRLYPRTAVLPFTFVPSESGSELAAERDAFAYIQALVAGDEGAAQAIRGTIIEGLNHVEAHGFMTHIAPDIPSIEVTEHKVIVHVGAKPEKKSWKEKGSGQMDPYIGMIAAAKYIYCFDRNGYQDRRMVVQFTHLPKDFWWFKNWEKSKSLYKTLAFEIADQVDFCGA